MFVPQVLFSGQASLDVRSVRVTVAWTLRSTKSGSLRSEDAAIPATEVKGSPSATAQAGHDTHCLGRGNLCNEPPKRVSPATLLWSNALLRWVENGHREPLRATPTLPSSLVLPVTVRQVARAPIQ